MIITRFRLRFWCVDRWFVTVTAGIVDAGFPPQVAECAEAVRVCVRVLSQLYTSVCRGSVLRHCISVRCAMLSLAVVLFRLHFLSSLVAILFHSLLHHAA
jgi:hypothetical protein